MKHFWITGLLVATLGLHAGAQEYRDSIVRYRKQYVVDLLKESRLHMTHEQARNLSFFQPDSAYRAWATFTPTVGGQPFKVDTHSGKQKPFKEYGVLTFTIHDTVLQLHVYQSIDLMKEDAHKDELFVPFNDETNYVTTYGGGRYLDLDIKNIHDGGMLVDFNKCYNPYCAYADGFSCPIPPKENMLHLEIRAGEKTFTQ